jgi:hypothetical protein
MNDMSDNSLFADCQKARKALDAAETAHPNSAALHILHGRLNVLLMRLGPAMLSRDEVMLLGGGTPKTDPAG